MTPPITCPVRLSTAPIHGAMVSIKSPKTGTELTVPAWRVDSRVRGRIAQAVGDGRHVVTFTVEELQAFAFAWKISQPPPPMKFAPVYHRGNRRTGDGR